MCKRVIDFCECEHESHFPKSEADLENRQVHAYGSSHYSLKKVHTEYGSLMVCERCAETCLKDFILESESHDDHSEVLMDFVDARRLLSFPDSPEIYEEFGEALARMMWFSIPAEDRSIDAVTDQTYCAMERIYGRMAEGDKYEGRMQKLFKGMCNFFDTRISRNAYGEWNDPEQN